MVDRFHPKKLTRLVRGRAGERALGKDDLDRELHDSIAESALNRIKSVVGRPTAAEWEIRRLVPFRRTDWRRLKLVADMLGVSAGQVAAMLIEAGLATLLLEARTPRRKP